jgi:imidazolonepropionase-like amidohydrolase
VRAATMDAAALLGLGNRFGQIKKGMSASFVITKGNPSCLPAALTPPEMVYLSGKRWIPLTVA